MADEPSDSDLLQRIDGIGPKKSERLVERFDGDTGSTIRNITTASTSSLSEVEGISDDTANEFLFKMRSQDIDQGLYDDDPRERKSRTFGEASDAVESGFGDLTGAAEPDEGSPFVEVNDTDFTRTEEKRASKFHAVRSDRAKTVDEKKQAPIADSFDQWRNNKDRFDFPGVDTLF